MTAFLTPDGLLIIQHRGTVLATHQCTPETRTAAHSYAKQYLRGCGITGDDMRAWRARQAFAWDVIKGVRGLCANARKEVDKVGVM